MQSAQFLTQLLSIHSSSGLRALNSASSGPGLSFQIKSDASTGTATAEGGVEDEPAVWATRALTTLGVEAALIPT